MITIVWWNKIFSCRPSIIQNLKKIPTKSHFTYLQVNNNSTSKRRRSRVGWWWASVPPICSTPPVPGSSCTSSTTSSSTRAKAAVPRSWRVTQDSARASPGSDWPSRRCRSRSVCSKLPRERNCHPDLWTRARWTDFDPPSKPAEKKRIEKLCFFYCTRKRVWREQRANG